MSDRLLKESDVLRAVDKRIEVLSKDPVFVRKNGLIDVMGVKKHILAIPSADRPQGEVDAVKIYEKAESQLERNEITVGEFEKIIEPLRHLFYNRPQGEWIRTGRTNIYGGIEVQCSNCGDKVMVQHLEDEWFCRHCGADMGMKGADDEV